MYPIYADVQKRYQVLVEGKMWLEPRRAQSELVIDFVHYPTRLDQGAWCVGGILPTWKKKGGCDFFYIFSPIAMQTSAGASQERELLLLLLTRAFFAWNMRCSHILGAP